MNWEDERYVRLYTRDTITWKLLGWEGRFVMMSLLRKVDRAGCLDLEAGTEGLSALLEMPEEIVQAGLAACTKRGTVQQRGSMLVLPRFLEAQEAKQSDRQRQRECRERRRDLGQRANVVGLSHEPESQSRIVTEQSHMLSRGVTESHTDSPAGVTPSCTVPSCTDPPKSPKGDLPGLKSDKPLPPGFWQRFVARAGKEWGLPERFAKSCEAIGAIVPGREQAQLLAGALEAQQAGFTEQDFMKLADFIAAGGVSWRSAAWQHISKNFVAELSKALAWDGVSDPRQRTPTPKAPAQLPQSPQPQRVYTETTAKRQADAIERGELPEVDPAIVAAELRKMQEATS